MNVSYTKLFQKKLMKLPAKIQLKLKVRLQKFLVDPSDIQLKDHSLKGTLLGKRSFSVTGDYRVVYRYIASDHIKLVDIGSHSQLY